jgi:predicted ArsR family transcriptional regulator
MILFYNVDMEPDPSAAAPSPLERRIAGIAALDQPLRRDIYRVLSETNDWTSRDDTAAALDLPRSVAAFHLDKLVDAGVLEVRFERTSGRQGPGAGRPSKLYRPSQDEVAASIPERHYDLAGSLLATAIAESTKTGAPVGDCLRVAAHAAGRAIGEETASSVEDVRSRDDRRAAVMDVLARHGYEPESAKRNQIALANCPFHRLAEAHRQLVCGMNLDFLDGLIGGIGPKARLTARLDPQPGYCCVRISAT